MKTHNKLGISMLLSCFFFFFFFSFTWPSMLLSSLVSHLYILITRPKRAPRLLMQMINWTLGKIQLFNAFRLWVRKESKAVHFFFTYLIHKHQMNWIYWHKFIGLIKPIHFIVTHPIYFVSRWIDRDAYTKWQSLRSYFCPQVVI